MDCQMNLKKLTDKTEKEHNYVYYICEEENVGFFATGYLSHKHIENICKQKCGKLRKEGLYGN